MDFEAARKHMVDSQVRPNDVTDSGLIKAMGAVGRYFESGELTLTYKRLAIITIGLLRKQE